MSQHQRVVAARVPPEVYQRLVGEAAEAGLSLSELVLRRVLTGLPPEPQRRCRARMWMSGGWRECRARLDADGRCAAYGHREWP
jgi:hypothetical protein